MFWIAGAQAVHDDGAFELDEDATNDVRPVALDTLQSNINATTTTIVVCRKTSGEPPTTIADPATPFDILIDAEVMTVTAIGDAGGGGCATDKDSYTVDRDGNGTDDNAAHAGGSDVTQLIAGTLPGDDWDDVYASFTADPAARCADLDADACAFIADPQEPTGTTIFIGGGSKDDLDIPSWQWTAGSVPDADEILDAYAIKYSTGGSQILYFGADRYATNGAKDFGFWFFREPVTKIGTTSGTFEGEHTARTAGDDGIPNNGDDDRGDILILGTFTQGGATTNIRVFEWVGTGGDATANGTVAGPIGTLGDCVPGSALDEGCATVNNTSILSPWPYEAKGASADGFIPSGGFVEGGIDLTALGLEGCFASFVAETRTSPSVDAQLKDFVLGNFEACDASVTTTPVDPEGNAVDEITFGDDIYDYALIVGTGGGGNPTGTMEFFICAPDELTNGACETGGTEVNGDGAGALNPPVDVTPITGTSNSEATSSAFTPDETGTWCWRGEYSGDDNYPAATDASTGECFDVLTIPTAVSTDQSWTTNDSATVSTQTGTLSGSVTFTLFGPGDDNCDGTAVYQETVELVGGSASETVSTTNGDGDSVNTPADFVVTEANDGTYSWLVEFDSGDTAHEDSTSACHVEHSDLTITEPAE